MSDGQKIICAALMRAQQKFLPIEKNTDAFKYKYAPLDVCFDAIKPALFEEGIMVFQPSRVTGYGQTIQSTILMHPESGESITSEFPISMDGGPQDHGSASTYYKRYTFLGVCGVQPVNEDDDGAAHQKASKAKPSKAPKFKPVEPRKKSGIETVYSVFLQNAKNLEDLSGWWEKNREELDKLKSTSEEKWSGIVSEFANRKKQIEEK